MIIELSMRFVRACEVKRIDEQVHWTAAVSGCPAVCTSMRRMTSSPVSPGSN